MRVVLVLLFVVVILCSFINASATEVESERTHTHNKNKHTTFRLLERVQREREREKQKLKLEEEMILEHAKVREMAKRAVKGDLHNGANVQNSKHSLETLTHGSEYAARKASTTSALSNTVSLSAELEKHHIKERESDAIELKNIRRILANLDKTKSKNQQKLSLSNKSKQDQTKKDENKLILKQKIAERRLHQLEKQEQDRREELLDRLELGDTETISSVELRDTNSVLNQFNNFIETKANTHIKTKQKQKQKQNEKADPAWAEKPSWWKVPPSEVDEAGTIPWPSDPLYQNGYPATIIDQNNYPLSNVDDPNNYPALDDPNGAFAPIQQPH